MDPILFRGIERLTIVAGAVFIAFLGFRLFIHGKERGRGELKVESDILKLVVSGQGPGLFFMVFGALILIFAVANGGASNKEVEKMVSEAVYRFSESHLQSMDTPSKATKEILSGIDEIVARIAEIESKLEDPTQASIQTP